MTDLELDSMAEGLYKFLAEKTESPLDGIAVLGITLIKVFNQGTDGTINFQRFAKDFHDGLVASWNARSDAGSSSLQ